MEPPSPASGWTRARLTLSRLRPLATGLRKRAGGLAHGLRTQAPTLRGQLTGVIMMTTPAVVHALPLDGEARTVVLNLAVVVGSAGALIVFGGLLLRAVLEPSRFASANSVAPVTRPAAPATVDDALLTLPHARAAWGGLVLLTVVLGAGALWYLVRLITGQGAEQLPGFLLLGLPAAALGWAAWRGRVMWAPTDRPV